MILMRIPINLRSMVPITNTANIFTGIMQLVAEKGFSSFIRPRSIFTSHGLGIIATRSICVGMARIRCYESGILHDSLLHLEFHGIKLPLHLSPYFLVYSFLSKAFSKFPNRCGIWNSLRCPKKHSKRNAIGNFAFKLLIG